MKKRIVALDIGTKRVGIAVSDALWLGATPIGTIERKAALDRVVQVCSEYNTDTILIGIPYNMDGSLGSQAKDCLNFIKPLREKYHIIEQDERLSSSTAEEILRMKGKKYTKNKGLVDTAAACVILTEYLDNNR